MVKTDLLKLLERLGIRALDIQDGWVQVSCPLAQTNHISKSDKNPSAGFSINNNGPSVFHCFVCGTRSIESILNTYKWKRGIDLFREYLNNEIQEKVQKVAYQDKFQKKKDPVPVPNEILRKFETIEKAENYLIERGIDLNIARHHGLLYCNEFKTAEGKIWKNAILTPVRDIDYKTYWIHFRSIDSKFFWHGKSKHFGMNIGWGREDSFFGMEHLDITKPVVIVEGAFDVLRLKTLGLSNVIGTHGGISHKSKKLQRLINLEVICGFDSDKAGNEFHKSVERFFNKKIQKLDWNMAGIKDPGELKSKEDLEKVLDKPNRSYTFQNKWRKL